MDRSDLGTDTTLVINLDAEIWAACPDEPLSAAPPLRLAPDLRWRDLYDEDEPGCLFDRYPRTGRARSRRRHAA
ncbi:MAG: hypothetical protein WC683_01645 [bacterium]